MHLSDTISVIAEQVRSILNLDGTTPISIFEELLPHQIDSMNQSSTFSQEELRTGDILIAQITPTVELVPIGDFFFFLVLLVCFVEALFEPCR